MLLDSDVMIDVLRGHGPALAWLSAAPAQALSLPSLVAMELIAGCKTLADQKSLQTQLKRFAIHWPTASDCERANADFADFHLSHNLGILDSLIGQTAVGLGKPLATFNVKHYSVIRGLTTVQPY